MMKKKSAGKKEVKRTLTLNKRSVKDLTVAQRKQIQGGKAKAIISLVFEMKPASVETVLNLTRLFPASQQSADER